MSEAIEIAWLNKRVVENEPTGLCIELRAHSLLLNAGEQ